jgi:hypothetical protein
VPKSGIVADTYVARVVLSEKTPRAAAGEVPAGEVVAEDIRVEITISNALATQSGDNELWRHSRLRWLDSTVGDSTVGDSTVGDSTVGDSTVADEPAANGSSVNGGLSRLRGSRGCALGQADCIAVENAAYGTLLSAPGGRQLGIGSTGLPLSLRVGGAELLAAPARLRLLRAHLGLTLSPDGPLHLERRAGGAVSWRQKLRAEEASVRVHIWGSMEVDGLAQMSAEIQIVQRSSQMSAEIRRTAEEEVSSNATIALDDVRLELVEVAVLGAAAVEALARRLDATYQCGCHMALGMAQLATTSAPALTRSMTSEPTAPAPKAKAMPKPKSRRRAPSAPSP